MTIQFSSIVDFTTNKIGETGRSVEPGFEFHSGRNSHTLGIEEIIAMNDIAQAK